MKKLLRIVVLGLLWCNVSNVSFADIKKPKIQNIGIVFPIIENKKFPCRVSVYLYAPVKPIKEIKAPSGYGLDDAFSDYVYDTLEKVSVNCSSGYLKACESIYKTLLNWSMSDAAKRTGPSDGEGRHWNDTLTVNLYVAAPMITAYSFAIQRMDIPKEDDEIIKKWLKKIVKKNQHLMYGKTYDYGGAKGTPKRAHNHALSSAMSHMSLAILLGDDKMFKKPFKNWIGAVKYQRKDGSLPIETRRGGRAMFYQGRAMTALATIAVMAENQNINIWNTKFKKNRDYHNIVKFFIDFAENPEIVFKYAKEMKSPGPAKNYKNQDLNSSGSVWGWMPAYASRFPNHENIKRIKSWDKVNMNKYQKLMISALSSVGGTTREFAASWNVGAEPNCHFIK